jgi:hypothetical protein
MSFDYASLATLATELLTEFGGPVVRRSSTLGAYDPETGQATHTDVDTPRIGALFDFSGSTGISMVRGQLVKSDDKQLLLDPNGSCEAQDHFIINGTNYSVVSVGTIKPASVVVIYDVHVRI